MVEMVDDIRGNLLYGPTIRGTRVTPQGPRRHGRPIAVAFLAAVIWLLAGSTALAGERQIKIPKAVAVAALNNYASSMEVKIDNWGSFRSAGGGTWEVDDSYILFPSSNKTPLAIPRSPTVEKALRSYNLYIDDMTSQGIDVKLEDGRLKVRVFFESAGNELRIGCRYRGKPCKTHIFKHTGDLNNVHMYAYFKPTFTGSKLQLVPQDLTLDYDISLDSKTANLFAASRFDGLKKKARDRARDAFVAEFNKPDVKNRLSKDLNDLLFDKLHDLLKDKLGAKTADFIKNNVKITSLKEQGNDYVITVSYPDIIGGNSAKMKSQIPAA